jgi:membrane-bound metal-dependent hydrolase YbcI (DUF457 family)
MAGYREHITVSGILGVGWGCAAFLLGGFSLMQSIIAGVLTWVSGMLPDLDAEGGRPIRELTGLTSAFAPLLVVQHAHSLGMADDHVLFAGILVWALVRYGGSFLLAKLTVHRGMFHSIPAMLIAAELMFLVYPSQELRVRLLMGLGVGIGFLSHLLLDEVYSVQWDGARVRLAKSAGSALKIFGEDPLPNGIAMGLLLALTWAVLLKLEVIRDPARIPAPEMYDMTGELPDAPLYRLAEEPCVQVTR